MPMEPAKSPIESANRGTCNIHKPPYSEIPHTYTHMVTCYQKDPTNESISAIIKVSPLPGLWVIRKRRRKKSRIRSTSTTYSSVDT